MSKKNIPPIQALIEEELTDAGFYLGLQELVPGRKTVVFHKDMGDILQQALEIEILPYGPCSLGLFIRVIIFVERPTATSSLDVQICPNHASCGERKALVYNLSRLYEDINIGPTVVINPLDKSSSELMVRDLLTLALSWLSKIRNKHDALSHVRSFERKNSIRSNTNSINRALFWACAAYYCLRGDQFLSEVARIDAWLSRIAPAAKRDGY